MPRPRLHYFAALLLLLVSASLVADDQQSGQLSFKQLRALKDRWSFDPNGFRPENTHANWEATILPPSPTDNSTGDNSTGQGGILRVSVQVDSKFHIYRFVPGDPNPQFRTLIVGCSDSNIRFSAPTTKAKIVKQDLGDGLVMEYYEGNVTWDIPFEFVNMSGRQRPEIQLFVGFNTCDDKHCDPPAGIRFFGRANLTDGVELEPVGLLPVPIDFNDVSNRPELTSWISNLASDDAVSQQNSSSANAGNQPLSLWMMLAALTGGFILNFMPCVLPVVGLKLMSFVRQSGSDHRQVVALNLAFVAGILAVVLGLAAFNIATKLAGQAVGWGEQFNSFPLQIGIVILLFAMSLSFLGVWEIPIPGFASGNAAGELMAREGLSGAFYKGILTTILATPCSGPLLGAVFGETLKLSILGSVTIFLCVGIGLGLPYLAMCVWPSIVRWLPKPGAWMETLKQFLAFPMLLSMIWFLNVIDSQYHIAMLVLLVGVWFGCWVLGRVPVYAESHFKIRIWATVITGCVIVGLVSFRYLGPVKHHLPWQPYSEVALEKHRASGKVVMIEFTARWCPTCQTNMRFAIDRPDVAKLVQQHGVVTLLADWTDNSTSSINSKAIRKKVQELQSNSIPLLAIYPPEPNAQPIILRDVITQSQLLEAIQKACTIDSSDANSRTAFSGATEPSKR